MILSGIEIEKRLDKDISIDPYNKKQLNPNSYNLRLYNKLLSYEDEVFDMKKPLKTKKIIIPKSGIILCQPIPKSKSDQDSLISVLLTTSNVLAPITRQ